ncbi:Ctr-domain-containing protein [Hyphopichia burtonii NRRL Y-1933]|uniref:Copper transport protein n=1 Tax=Hyphopichia burtonii NRRL Y-1933 TaxID=984485 RepID=A0A1E4RGZ3_9ASCO|nr:Ctr-domain-containing protein [Hyphopichia burtonii NRRL Y-1933]ODV66530.1 Ctr-domain-containing protein [Hyphopichia burtonii NRRL Y-1933]
MDHSSMGHSMPGHEMPGHDMPGHDMPMDEMCSMNMIFTWNWKNTCIIYEWWHIKTFTQFVISFVAVVLLGMGYEFTKNLFNRWQVTNINMVNGTTNTNSNTIKKYKLQQSLFYGFQVGYSFMLMLVFMTYNGWFMLAVVIGAVIGHNIWNNPIITDDRSMACH